jgi:hypothetical protein
MILLRAADAEGFSRSLMTLLGLAGLLGFAEWMPQLRLTANESTCW